VESPPAQKKKQQKDSEQKEAFPKSVVTLQVFWYLGDLPLFCEIQNGISANLILYAISYAVTTVTIMFQQQRRKENNYLRLLFWLFLTETLTIIGILSVQ